MSKEAKNEIDLMLRQLGRRDAAALFEPDEQHLDADELNSYVANALPPAARARYMEHLADCASCRRLAVQLSAAQGPVVVEHAGSIQAPSALKQFLAGLLSPMVLRYAVPALGVLVIMVVGFVVMRRGPAQDRVAQIMPNEQRPSVAVDVSPAASPSTAAKAEDSGHNQLDRPAESAAGKSAQGQAETSGELNKEKPGSVAVTANEPVMATPDSQPIAKSPESAPSKAAAPQSGSFDAYQRADSEKKAAEPPAPKKLAEVDVRQREEQKEAQRQTASVDSTSGTAVNRSVQVGSLAGPSKAARTKRDSDEEVDKTTPKDDEAAKDKNEAAAETRSVAGRRFRKSGNVWIDTAYKSSLTMVSMSRGSEQYRTLIGDEPEIRKIAEQLDGEFVVVWKGRAYRIR